MSKLKLLLGDPRHKTVGAHSYFVPIGIGYIASNILNKYKEKIEVRLSVDADEILDIIDQWKQTSLEFKLRLEYTSPKFLC